VLGTLYCPLEIDQRGKTTNPCSNHQCWWIGEPPCDSTGRVMTEMISNANPENKGDGIETTVAFSRKRGDKQNYNDFHEKIWAYVRMIWHEAQVIDASCDPRSEKPIPTFDSFDAAENARQKNGVTLALVRPTQIVGLDVKQVDNPDWTEEEKAKLQQAQNQGGLFDNTDARDMRLLKKLPFDFHYRYQCESAEGLVESRHKLVDWEAGALFWNVYRRHRSAWETPFRDKLEKNLPAADLMFLMGTIHRFPDQWLIVSLIYPPKQPQQEADQLSLL